MKRITIVVSGGQEESLAKKLAKEAAQMLAENWDAGCSIQVDDVKEKKTESSPIPREDPFAKKNGLQVPGFMAPGNLGGRAGSRPLR